MRTVLISVLLLCNVFLLCGEKIYWADSLIAVSSEARFVNASKTAFKGIQALGKPNIMPDFGVSPCAWMPDYTRNGMEWIKVGFKKSITASRLFIYESYNPGAISKVIVFDENENEKVVYNNLNPIPVQETGRVMNVTFSKTKVKSVRIEITTVNYKDYYQIDAIGICDCEYDYFPKINQPENVSYEEKINLGENVNSKYAELGPVITPDGTTLYFTRDQHPDNTGENKDQDIWYSSSDSLGNFSPAQNMNAPINNEWNNFAIGISQDGNVLYLGNVYNTDGTQSKGLSRSFLTDSGWSFPQKIEIEDYYNLGRFSSFSFSTNGKVLIMSVERRDGYGENDLYVSFLQENGVWSKPLNLGSDINTAASEDTPFLAADGATLYFSSSGHLGYGSNDMFVARRLDDSWQRWTEPMNLGKPINSRGWDGYYSLPASGEFAYFVSNENSIGREDIFKIKLPTEYRPYNVVLIKGKVLNAKTKKPVEATIKYEYLENGKNAGIAKSNPKTGEYVITLPGGHRYAYYAVANGFLALNENIDLSSLEQYKEIRRDLLLVPIEIGQKVVLNNIFFEYGKYELLEESFAELERVKQFMLEYPNIKISIEGHTDNIGSLSYNMQLSQNRAKAVRDWLVGNGVEASRIKYKGYGPKKPIATNSTEEGRSRNRRVEFEIE
ncbi:MAG: OmpA family protein [Bacteroidota bacterium]